MFAYRLSLKGIGLAAMFAVLVAIVAQARAAERKGQA